MQYQSKFGVMSGAVTLIISWTKNNTNSVALQSPLLTVSQTQTLSMLQKTQFSYDDSLRRQNLLFLISSQFSKYIIQNSE